MQGLSRRGRSDDLRVVSAADVVLLDVASVAARFPGRWWVPPADMLAAVAPERAYVKVMALERHGSGEVDVWGARAIWLDVEERDAEGRGDVWDARPIWLDVEECDADGVAGPIVDSEIERQGFGDGDHIVVPWGRIFDLVLLDADGEAIFNEQRARFAIGKRVLVGISVLTADELGVAERRTFAGTVASVEAARGIELRLDDRSSYWLPPDMSALREAAPAEYVLRATGQTVVNPDYTTTWTVTQSGFESFQLPGGGFVPPEDAAESPGP